MKYISLKLFRNNFSVVPFTSTLFYPYFVMMVKNSTVCLLVNYCHVHLPFSCLPHSSPISLICRTYRNFFPLPFVTHIYNKMIQRNNNQNIPLRDNNSRNVTSGSLLHYSNEWTISALFNFFTSSFLRQYFFGQSQKENI